MPFDFLDEFFDQLMTDLPGRNVALYSSNGYWVGNRYPDTWDLAVESGLQRQGHPAGPQ